MKSLLFAFFVVTVYSVVSATGTVDEVTAEAGKEVGSNAKAMGYIFQEIGKLQNQLYPVEKHIRGESEQVTASITQRRASTLVKINNVDKPDCRVKAKKSLDLTFEEHKTTIIDCQQATIEQMNKLEHDLKTIQKSLKKLKKTNGKLINNCYKTTNQQAEELENCFKSKDSEVKADVQKQEDSVNNVKQQIADMHSDSVINCIQKTEQVFNTKTDKIVTDVIDCGGVQ